MSASISALEIWLFDLANVVTVRAYGVVFGYLGFLLLRGLFARSTSSILTSSTAAFFYGGTIRGILPSSLNIFWQAHLSGLVGDVLAATLDCN